MNNYQTGSFPPIIARSADLQPSKATLDELETSGKAMAGFYDDEDYEEEHYDRYRGSYAQEVEGWSDELIDDVFDGDPDAY